MTVTSTSVANVTSVSAISAATSSAVPAVIAVTPEALIAPEVAVLIAVKSFSVAVPVTVAAKSPSIVESSVLS